MLDLAVLDLTAELGDLEPAKLAQSLGGSFDALFYSIGMADFGTADDFDDTINMVCHTCFLPDMPLAAGSANCPPSAARQVRLPFAMRRSRRRYARRFPAPSP